MRQKKCILVGAPNCEKSDASSLFMDLFPCDNTTRLHPFESFHFLTFCCNHHLLTHVCLRQPFVCDPITTANCVIFCSIHTRVDLQSELKSGPVSQVAPNHHSRYCRRVHVSPLPDQAPG